MTSTIKCHIILKKIKRFQNYLNRHFKYFSSESSLKNQISNFCITYKTTTLRYEYTFRLMHSYSLYQSTFFLSTCIVFGTYNRKRRPFSILVRSTKLRILSFRRVSVRCTRSQPSVVPVGSITFTAHRVCVPLLYLR